MTREWFRNLDGIDEVESFSVEFYLWSTEIPFKVKPYTRVGRLESYFMQVLLVNVHKQHCSELLSSWKKWSGVKKSRRSKKTTESYNFLFINLRDQH